MTDLMPEPEGPEDERFVYVVTAEGAEALRTDQHWEAPGADEPTSSAIRVAADGRGVRITPASSSEALRR